MSIKEMEALLEATRKEICNQLSTVDNGYYRSIQSIDSTLYEKERELEQAIHYLKTGSFIDVKVIRDALRKQVELPYKPVMKLGDLAMPQVEFKEAIYELAFGDNAINRGFSEEEVIATIKGFAHDSWVAEEFDHEMKEQDEPMSSNRWRGILQELAQRCPPDRWADDHQEGPSPDTFECGYCCALMQLHAMSMREGHCIPIDEFPVPYIVEQANLADLIAPHEGDKE